MVIKIVFQTVTMQTYILIRFYDSVCMFVNRHEKSKKLNHICVFILIVGMSFEAIQIKTKDQRPYSQLNLIRFDLVQIFSIDGSYFKLSEDMPYHHTRCRCVDFCVLYVIEYGDLRCDCTPYTHQVLCYSHLAQS